MEEPKEFNQYIVICGLDVGKRFTGGSLVYETIYDMDNDESAYWPHNLAGCTCDNHKSPHTEDKEYCEYHDFHKWPLRDDEMILPGTPIVVRKKPTRPDFSAITKQKFVLSDNMALVGVKDQHGDIVVQYFRNDPVAAYIKAIANIPQLITIAEMYFDELQQRKSSGFPFDFIQKTLNDIKV